MKVFKNALCVGLLVLAAACGNNNSTPENNPVTNTAKKGLEAEPLISKADSAQLLYYDEPDGDSLRYSRFFSFVNTADTAVLRVLKNSLNIPFEQLHTVKNCRSEGKIYLFNKQQPVKTIYFSAKGSSCSYLYFIKDGNFLYFPLSKSMQAVLSSYKTKAVKESSE